MSEPHDEEVAARLSTELQSGLERLRRARAAGSGIRDVTGDAIPTDEPVGGEPLAPAPWREEQREPVSVRILGLF